MLRRLVPLEARHIEFVYETLNDEKLTETYPVSYPYTRQEAKYYVQNEIKGRENGTRFAFIIEIAKLEIGVCALYNVSHFTKSAKIYYWLASKFWNKGITTNAVKQLMEYAWSKHEIKTLRADVLERNITSVKVLQKNGFTLENEIINKGLFHNKFYDEKVLAFKADLSGN